MGVVLAFPITESCDGRLEVLVRLIAKFNIEDHIPESMLLEFERLLAQSSYREIVVSSAPARMREAMFRKDGVGYHYAYDDLIVMCDALKRAFPTPR